MGVCHRSEDPRKKARPGHAFSAPARGPTRPASGGAVGMRAGAVRPETVRMAENAFVGASQTHRRAVVDVPAWIFRTAIEASSPPALRV